MPASRTGKTPRTVAGVDGSPSSLAALRWAVRQARLTGGTVDAVIAWQILAVAGGYGGAPLATAAGAGFEDSAKQALEEAVSDVAGPGGGRLVRGLIVPGIPAQVLLDASAGAGLLVVGSRGRGGFAGALPGSVSQHCAHHARCPVVIMRGDAAAKAAWPAQGRRSRPAWLMAPDPFASAPAEMGRIDANAGGRFR